MISTVSHPETPEYLLYLDRIKVADQFQLASPCFLSFSTLLIPPESVITTTDVELNRRVLTMPLKVLAEIPERTSVRGIPIPEFTEILEALKTLPKNKAIEVSLSDETAQRFTKKTKGGKSTNPATGFANSLKRKFATDGLAFECYVSSTGKTVIVRHEKKS